MIRSKEIGLRSAVPWVLVALAFVSACDDTDTVSLNGAFEAPGTITDPSAPPDSPADDEPDCFEAPTTHYELINACTDATRVRREPNLRLLNADGSLPAF